MRGTYSLFNRVSGLQIKVDQSNASIDIKVGGLYQGLEIKQILIVW